MGDKSAIQWTDATWNPVTGCSKVSPGCAHCYAETFAERWRGVPGHPYEQGFDLRLWPERLELPIRWTRPRRVFVNSMSDLFHEDIPWRFVAQVFAVMSIAEQHTFQVLTKRAPMMHQLLTHSHFWLELNAERLRRCVPVLPGGMDEYMSGDRTIPNVWLGVSVENRKFTDRAEILTFTPAAVRFVSAEPLLGPLDSLRLTGKRHPAKTPLPEGASIDDVLAHQASTAGIPDLPGIDWLIVGGESGAGHRRIDPDWVRDLQAMAAAAGTAFFFKQWGGARPKSNGRELDGRTWDEMPAQIGGAS